MQEMIDERLNTSPVTSGLTPLFAARAGYNGAITYLPAYPHPRQSDRMAKRM